MATIFPYHATASAILLVVILAGCKTTELALPYQTGENRYQMDYRGQESFGSEKAQTFCRQKGFDYAHVNYDTSEGEYFAPRQVSFFCMHNGDTINYPRTNTTVCLPGINADDPITCNSN